jgi:hypothetical protein
MNEYPNNDATNDEAADKLDNILDSMFGDVQPAPAGQGKGKSVSREVRARACAEVFLQLGFSKQPISLAAIGERLPAELLADDEHYRYLGDVLGRGRPCLDENGKEKPGTGGIGLWKSKGKYQWCRENTYLCLQRIPRGEWQAQAKKLGFATVSELLQAIKNLPVKE